MTVFWRRGGGGAWFLFLRLRRLLLCFVALFVNAVDLQHNKTKQTIGEEI
jgi:hypothetical protein